MLLGESRGNVKKEHCIRCNQVVHFNYDHAKKMWVCPNCD